MRILILGLGVIGTTYGYAFQKAGHEVKHLIRESKRATTPHELEINLFDGRYNRKGEEKKDFYTVKTSECGEVYDFIIISVPDGKIADAVATLRDNKITGTLLLFCNFWNTRDEVQHMVQNYAYVIGFPIAGGHLEGCILNCVLFDHIMLESKEKTEIDNYNLLENLLISANIKTEVPFDMVEWIWLHMAINAAVTITAAKGGDLSNPSLLAKNMMSDSKALSEVVLTIRETSKIVAARGVNLRKYANELMPYKFPSRISGFVMKKLFARNELTRRIMLLHNDISDILFGCTCVYETGKALGVETPLFTAKYEAIVGIKN